jgi:hypothetical protein
MGGTWLKLEIYTQLYLWSLRWRPLGRSRSRWQDSSLMDLMEIGCGGLGVYWIRLTQDRVQWLTQENVPSCSISCGENARKLWLTERRLASQDEFCSLELFSSERCVNVWNELGSKDWWGIECSGTWRRLLCNDWCRSVHVTTTRHLGENIPFSPTKAWAMKLPCFVSLALFLY